METTIIKDNSKHILKIKISKIPKSPAYGNRILNTSPYDYSEIKNNQIINYNIYSNCKSEIEKNLLISKKLFFEINNKFDTSGNFSNKTNDLKCITKDNNKNRLLPSNKEEIDIKNVKEFKFSKILSSSFDDIKNNSNPYIDSPDIYSNNTTNQIMDNYNPLEREEFPRATFIRKSKETIFILNRCYYQKFC